MNRRCALLLALVVGLPLMLSNHVDAQQQPPCCFNNSSYSLTITFNDVTASTSGSITGTNAPFPPGTGRTLFWTIQRTGGSSGASPSIGCWLGGTPLFYEQVGIGGGQAYITLPTTAQTTYLQCDINEASGNAFTPEIPVVIN